MKHFIFVVLLMFSLSTKATETISDDQHLLQILASYTEHYQQLDPYNAIYTTNAEKYLNQFGNYLSPSYLRTRTNLYRRADLALNKINPKKLSAARLQSYKLFRQDVSTQLQLSHFPWYYLDFNQSNDRLRDFIDSGQVSAYSYFPFDTVAHYKAFTLRAKGLKSFVDTYIQLHRDGLKKGIVQTCAVAHRAIRGLAEGAIDDPEKSPFWSPIKNMPATFSAREKQTLTQDFRNMITHDIAPEYARFIYFYTTEYLPHCRESYGLSGLPQGQKWYEASIYQQTTTKLSAEEIHNIGLKEVDRIEKEMEEVKSEFKFKGTLKDFLLSLKNDPNNYFHSRKEMLAKHHETLDKIATLLPKYFSVFPKSSFIIVEDPNPNQPAARYAAPTETQPNGRLVLNTANLKSSQIADTTTLDLHEGIPGHHFQMTLAFEKKKELTEYERVYFSANAFNEGWALYSEYLGREMGLYADPLQRIGNLDQEMFRAVRLVVDTGIHHYGWTREQVLAYMSEHLASDASEIEAEADRYAGWPGQALGYKLGQLKILELRQEAEKALGKKFNIKEFHNAVIGHGNVTLDILSDNVHHWIKASLQ